MPKRSQQLTRAGRRVALGEPLQAPEQHQVLAAGQALVQRGLLAGDARSARAPPGVGGDVVAGHERAAGGGGEQRREDPHRGRLARAVVAEQAEHGARLDREIQPRERLGVAEARVRVHRFVQRTSSYGVR